MTLSFFYWAFRRVLELLVLRFRPDLEKDLELIVLRPGVPRSSGTPSKDLATL